MLQKVRIIFSRYFQKNNNDKYKYYYFKKRWFDCPDCHEELTDHKLKKTTELVFACKKCSKVFRKDVAEFDE